MTGPMHGRRVLLVEDHPVNQRLALHLLAATGAQADLAATGAQAVAMVRAQRYDLVLMDMQLPEMDGLAATRAIRALPGAASRVTIVAMTATTFGDQSAACLDAGMDAYLEKPVDRGVLLETMLRLVQGGGAAQRPAPPAAGAPMPDLDGVLAPRGLRSFGGDRATYLDALLQFARMYAAGLPSFAAWSAGTRSATGVPADVLARLRAEVHGLAGACAALGAIDLQAQAGACETWLDDAPGAAGPAIAGLQQRLVRLAAQWRDVLLRDAGQGGRSGVPGSG
ncbi:response regulator [Aquincola sp. MAHUQ-54]|uniref:Response regulator n=1 Tax=Aquincola agrisoli TaxID=3119538 RepID=A0AAW9Q8Z0_9BURK